MTNPCFCGCSLKTATLIVAVLDMIGAALLGIVALVFGGITIGALVGVADQVKDDDKPMYGAAAGVVVAGFVVLLLVAIGKFYLGLTLKRGADQEDLRKCRIWFIVTAVLFSLGVVVVFFNIISGHPVVNTVPNAIALLVEAFCLWVVYEYMVELKCGATFNNAPATMKV